MFEKASKKQLRFESSKGLLTTEDLWQLSLTALDTIAKKVNKEIREHEEESFVTTTRTATSDNKLRLDILKYVIDFKITEKDKAKAKAANQAQVAQLKGILADKQSEALKSMTPEEIEKQIAALS